MKYILSFWLLLTACFGISQTDTVSTIQFDQFDLFGGGTASLPIYYYPFYNGMQIVELDYYSQSVEQGRIEDQIHPRGGSSFWDAVMFNRPNGFIVRDSAGTTIREFNIQDADRSKILSPRKAATITHDFRMNQNRINDFHRNRDSKFRDQYGNAYRIVEHREKENIWTYKTGLMDTLGNVVIDPIYDQITHQEGTYLARKEDTWSMFSANFLPMLKDTYRRIERTGRNTFIACNEGCQYVNSQGEFLDSTYYEDIRTGRQPNKFDSYKLNGKYGLINGLGQRITEPLYQWIIPLDRGYCVTDTSHKYAILGVQGERLTDFLFEQNAPRWRRDGFYQVAIVDRDYREKGYTHSIRMGLVDTLGKEITGFEYDQIGWFNGGFAEARKNGKKGLINLKGEAVTEFFYDDIFGLSSNSDYINIKINGRFGTIDKKGKEVIPPIYRQISCISEDMAIVRGENRKIGFFGLNGQKDIPCIYDNAWCFKNGMARIVFEGKYGSINRNGEEITGYKYDHVFDFKPDIAVVKKGKVYGVIDKTGKELVPPSHYTSFEYEENGGIILKKGSQRKHVGTKREN